MSSEWRACPCGMKRDFMSRHNAEKALGKAQSMRSRRANTAGTRRGMKIEHRVYACDEGGWHLTSQSRASYQNRITKEVAPW